MPLCFRTAQARNDPKRGLKVHCGGILCHTARLYYTIPYPVLCYPMLSYAMLCYAILYSSLLYYAKLYSTPPLRLGGAERNAPRTSAPPHIA